jgi:EAL domain-containing protein (putative c-di-GMP-specific phosphodiesterase class I)
VVSLARDLDLEVLAEGVEELDQIAPLRAAGCHLGQGFVWGRAVPIVELVDRWGLGRSSTPLDYRSRLN